MMSGIMPNGTFGAGVDKNLANNVLRATVESEKAREEAKSYEVSNDFKGKENDPRARGAESSMDIIMNNN